MAVNNRTILGRVYLNATNDFQQRVPDPTIGDEAATMEFLTQPMNGKYMNEFIDSFVNVIGNQVVHNSAWENPLAAFKTATLRYGSTIQEAAPKWIKAHAYNLDDDTLLKVNRPEFGVFYHTVNRRDRYDISIERPDIEMAFHSEYGLNQLVNSILQVPRNSDNYDEYVQMMQMLAYYEREWGFYKQKLDKPTDEASGKAFLASVRSFANILSFPTSLYSMAGAELGIPTFAKPSELVLLIDAEADAQIDVNTLAGVFQLDKADIKYRKIVVPELPIPDAYALLTTEQLFVAADKLYETTSFYNPQKVATNYYLHHWEVVSISPVVPSILYVSSDTGTTVPVITQSVTGIDIAAEGSASTVEPGGKLQLTVSLTGTITDNEVGAEVEPDAVVWAVTASTAASDGDPIDLGTATYVDRLGVLHVGRKLATGNVLTVTGTAAYTNPSGTTSSYTDTLTLTVK